MMFNRKILGAQFAIAAFLTLTSSPSTFAQVTRYAQLTAGFFTDAQTPIPVPALVITLPAEAPTQKEALITLDMPNLFLGGKAVGGTLGGQVAVFVDGTSVAAGQISDDSAALPGDGRKTVVLVVKVPLRSFQQTVEAKWNGVRGSSIATDTFASLSATLVSK